jgi:cyclophilin family peptidyl-prolyl cis-trans isomerase
MCRFSLFVLFLFFIWGCEPEDREYGQLMRLSYPDLYEAVFERNDRALIAFTYDPNPAVSKQAWRALISTPVNGMDGFIEKVKEANTEEAWMALSTKTLTDEQLERLQDDFKASPELRPGIVQVLGRTGNRMTLIFLTENMNSIRGSDFEEVAALAIGRLMVQYDLNGESLEELTSTMLGVKDDNLLNHYLYGYFRGRKIPPLELSEALTRRWDDADTALKQTLIRILMHNHAEYLTSKLTADVIMKSETALAVELSNQLSRRKLNPDNEGSLIGILNHPNRSVVVHSLGAIAANDSLMKQGEQLVKSINGIFENEEAEAIVRLESARTLAVLGVWTGDMETVTLLAEENPYYLQQQLDIQVLSKPGEMPLLCSGENWEELRSDDLRLSIAGSSLARWWNNAEPAVQEDNLEEIQACVTAFLERGNRAQLLAILSLLSDPQVFPDFEYEALEDMFSRFSLPADIELYQYFGGILKDRFPMRAKAFVDSLAAYGNGALNSAFLDQGWDIEGYEQRSVRFRQPNWRRLAKLGPEPEMRLQTTQGDIRIRLFPEIAPATISGMDSLAAAGAYDGVAFHRVVQNFVIQGGDVETGLGWGGPDYTVPTEASSLKYKRGMVGIASAGTDTEGSQYFIMHQAAPHLNGLYSIIGEVVEGMDVVDRIVVGDRVEKLSIR